MPWRYSGENQPKIKSFDENQIKLANSSLPPKKLERFEVLVKKFDAKTLEKAELNELSELKLLAYEISKGTNKRSKSNEAVS